MGLADMVGEFLHAAVEQREILAQFGQLFLDDMHLLTGFRILEHRTRRVQHRHQRGRRDDPDALPVGILHQVAMVGVNLGEHRFRRQEHDGAIAGDAGDDIFAGDIIDVLLDAGLEHGRTDAIRPFGEHALVVFQREF